MNWDERGRLWVCETIDYPNELQTSLGNGRDRIKICEDTDNDGRADKFTVFAENLSIPSTLVCYRGGVIVQDGQTTVYLKDKRKIMVSKHLKEYETLLGDENFMRVHNSFLINLNEVKQFVKSEGGYILMNDNQQVSISPKRRDEFFARMN